MFTRLRPARLALFVGLLVAFVIPSGVSPVLLSQGAGVVVEGTVVDDELSPLAGVRVTLVQPGQNDVFRTTDEPGRFRFDSVKPGAYELRASRRGYESVSRKLSVSPTPATLKIPFNPASDRMEANRL